MEQDTAEKKVLSCIEARLLLKVISASKLYKDMNETEQAAVDHYVWCKDSCHREGFSTIRGESLTCRKALEIWAAKPGPLWLSGETIKEILAVEHVWGRVIQKSGQPASHVNYGACEQTPCRRLANYWAGAPLCSQYDGDREVAYEIPWIIRIFREQNWPLDNLLKIQRQRVGILLENFAKGEIPEDDRPSYHKLEHLALEIRNNVEILQDVILGKPTETHWNFRPPY